MHQQGKTPDERAPRGAGRIGSNPESNPGLHSMPDLQNDTDRALVACSLWLDVGFIGAAALVVGLLQWVDGGSNWPWALVMAFCGGVLAAASWHRSEMVVERAERAPAVATDAPREPASRTYSSLIGRGAIAVLSSIPLQPNRTHDHDLRSPSPE